MLALENWSLLAQNLKVLGLEARSVDRDNIFSFFCHWSKEKQLPCLSTGQKSKSLVKIEFILF